MNEVLSRIEKCSGDISIIFKEIKDSSYAKGEGDLEKYKENLTQIKSLLRVFTHQLKAGQQLCIEISSSNIGAVTSTKSTLFTYERKCEEARQQLRKCQLQYKDLETKRVQSSRASLLGSTDACLMEQRAKDRVKAVRDATEVTSGLRRIRSQMQSHVDRVGDISEVLDGDKELMAKAASELSSYSSNLQTTRNLLTKFKWADYWDSILLALCFAFFLSVVVYIAYKRIRFRIPVIGWIFGLD